MNESTFQMLKTLITGVTAMVWVVAAVIWGRLLSNIMLEKGTTHDS